MELNQQLMNSHLVWKFCRLNHRYLKVENYHYYTTYLETIIPEGEVIKQGNNFYIVQGDEVYKLGCAGDLERFVEWSKTYIEDEDLYGSCPEGI